MQEELTIGQGIYKKNIKSKYYGKILRTVTNNKDNIEKVRTYYWDNYKYAHDYIDKYNQSTNNEFQSYASQKVDFRELPAIALMMITTSDEVIQNGKVDEDKFKEFLNKMIEDFSYNPLQDPEFLNKNLDENTKDELGLKPSERARYERTKPYFEQMFKTLDETIDIEKGIYKKENDFKLNDKKLFNLYFSMRFAQGYFYNVSPKLNYEFVRDHYKTMEGRTAFNKQMDINNTFTNSLSLVFDDNGLDKATNPDLNIAADEMKMDLLLNEGSISINYDHKYDRLMSLNKDELLENDTNYDYMVDFGKDLDGLNIKSNGLFGYNDIIDQIYIDGKKLSTFSSEQGYGDKRAMCMQKLIQEIHKGTSVIEMVTPKQLGNLASVDIVPLKFNIDNKVYNEANLKGFKKFFYKIGLYKGIDINKRRDETYKNAEKNALERHNNIRNDAKQFIESLKYTYVSPDYDEKAKVNQEMMARHRIEINEIKSELNLNKELLENNDKEIENIKNNSNQKDDTKTK